MGPTWDGEEGPEAEFVIEDGVNVAGEKLRRGETAAVEGFGVGGLELDDGDFAGNSLSMSENGFDKDGRCTELGVPAFVGEQLNGC